MDKGKKEMLNTAKNIVIVFLMAIVSALNLHVLVIPAEFAPGGVDGISTMLNKLTDISAGWFVFGINLPLLILAWIFLKRRYVIYTVIYTIVSSLALVLLEYINFYQIKLPDEKLVVALFSGLIMGLRTGAMLKIGASTGGVDIAAGVITKFKPHIDVEKIIAFISYAIILSSIFVYHNVLSVMVSLVQMFVFKITAASILKDTRNAVEFRIITKEPGLIADKILNDLKHGATIAECQGAFTGEKRYEVIAIINIRQIPDMLAIVKEDENAFVTYTEAKGVKGNFRWQKDDEVK